jgi:tetratricopeptide (TPR) repeat protein
MSPTNIPGSYDEARVARLKPISTAIEQLGLPFVRKRKLIGILNALEMQIEDGGDSPAVNDHLLQALRESAVHQVGKKKAKPVMSAIDAFARAENKRWEQIKAGTLPPIKRSLPDQMEDLVHEAYRHLNKERQYRAACDRWLVAWEIAEQLILPEMRSTEDFEAIYLGGMYSFHDWCMDLMFELHNAGLDDERYVTKRLAFTTTFLEHFPDEDADTQVEFYRGWGESLWRLGRRAEAEAVFAEVVERFPDHAWGYIGWADHYWLLKDLPGDYERAEAIMRQALARPDLDRPTDVLERLEDLYAKWGKTAQRAATAAELARLRPPVQRQIRQKLSSLWKKPQDSPKTSQPRPKRNDPCWCGSGKKYKHCHMKQDRKGGKKL